MNRYTPNETNPLHNPETKVRSMNLSELALAGGIVTHVRTFIERRNGTWFADISHIDGTLPTGELVRVNCTPAPGERGAIMDELRD